MKKFRNLFMILAFVVCALALFSRTDARAEAVRTDGWETVYSSLQTDEDGNLFYEALNNVGSTEWMTFGFRALQAVEDGVSKMEVTSSNEKVCSIDTDSKVIALRANNYSGLYTVSLHIKSEGSAVVTARLGDKSYSFRVISLTKKMAKIVSVKKNDYSSVKLSWKKTAGASGYLIARAKMTGDDAYMLKQVKEINNPDITSVILPASLNVTYGYCVIPKVKLFSKEYVYPWIGTYYYGFGNTDESAEYKLVYRGAKLQNLTVKGKKVQISWVPDAQVSAYRIYRQEREGASWKLIHTIKNEKVGSYTVSQKVAKTCSYKVEYVRPNHTVQSTQSRSCYIPKTVKSKKTAIKIAQDSAYGQYGNGAWSGVDDVFYYERKNVLHAVAHKRNKNTLIDYTLTESGKVKSKKTVKLGKFDYWRGFYAGPDDCLYVAVGYDNSKKSRKKTVVKVMKYSASWKLQKTCKIKGSASNSFEGIICPDTNSRMMMYGSKLYLIMGRIMFFEGHESNIAFEINTKTMKYKEANKDYTSHSFNQFIRFDNGCLYISNHGDAYPRAVNLVKVKSYGTKNESIKEVLPFKIKGETGNNYTGLTEGGMEVTANHIMIAGASVPQKYKVAGVTGNKPSYMQNVYLTITDKTTMKSRIKWLTTYNPKKSKTIVSEVRMLKLSDDYVVVMYTTTKKSKDTLHYVVVNDAGKVVCHKTYKNMVFSASTQPILHNGAIVWTDVLSEWKKVKSKGYSYYDYVEKKYFCRIPAVIR